MKFVFKGAGGEISFETVIQSRTVLPEHVPINNGVYKSSFSVTAFLRRQLLSLPRLPQSGAWRRVKVMSVFLAMVYVIIIMNAYPCRHFLFAGSAAAEALCGAPHGCGEVRFSQLAAAWSTHSYRFSTAPRPYCCNKHKQVCQE